MLDEFLKGAKAKGAQIQKVFLGKMKITPCMEYYACMKTGNCSIKDEMTGLYKDIEKADVIALASPIFFYGLTAQAKALVDRCQAFWARKYIIETRSSKLQAPSSKRKGYFISTAATKGKKVFDGAKLTVKYFFDALDAKYSGQLLIGLAKYKDNITKHPTALKDAYKMGKEA